MKQKMNPDELNLYPIIDHPFVQNKNIRDVAEALCLGNANLIQYRNKVTDSREFYDAALLIHEITLKYHVPLIVNDRLDIALAIGAEGAHVGQTDLPATVVRKLTSKEFIIGISVSNWEEFQTIEEADYLGIGAIFPTSTKADAEHTGLDFLKQVRSKTQLPLVGIGGIHKQNLQNVLDHGADGVAVISALLTSDNIEQETREMANLISHFKEAKKL